MSNVYQPIGSQDFYTFLMCYFNVFSTSEYCRTGAIQICHYHCHFHNIWLAKNKYIDRLHKFITN